MTLSIDERKAVVTLRLENSRETLREVENILALGQWRTAANRLYYACYYAASALLIKNGYIAKTHAGVINLLGLHFVNKGLVDKKLGHFYSKLFELRQSGDYDAWTYIEEKDVTPLLEPAENFIASIEKLIELGV